MSQSPNEQEQSQWVKSLFYPLVVATMVSCIAWAIAALLAVYLDLNPAYVALGCMLVALEAGGSYRLLCARRDLRSEILKFRLVELSMILIVLKIVRYVGYSRAALQVEIEKWLRDPLLLLEDVQTWITFFLAVVIWLIATETLDDLENLNEPPERAPSYVPRADRLSSRFFWGGAVLLAVIGFTQALFIDPKELDLGRPPTTQQIFGALLYFFLGLVMLGQMQYTRLREVWSIQEAQVSEKLAGRWVRYSLTFVGLAILLAALLPKDYTLGLLGSVGLVLGVLFQILWLFITLILFLFQLLLWPFALLFGSSESRPEMEPPKLEFAPQTLPPTETGDPSSWLSILKSLVFWAVLAIVLFYVVRAYLRDRSEIQRAMRNFRPLQWLRRAWVLLKRWLRTWGKQLEQTVRERLPHRLPRRLMPEGSGRLPARFFRLGGLSPRERILYYYLSILKRARQRGFPRADHQTPHEYYDTLGPNLPQAKEEMELLTRAFIEARYSRHELGPEQDEQVRDNWRRVRAALRALKRQGDSNGSPTKGA